MGIQCLETVVESKEKEGLCRQVHLGQLAEEYVKQTGKEPVLVIDGTYLLHHFYKITNKYDFLCGGQLRQLTEFAVDFINKLQVLKIKPVFYFDGPTVEAKITRRKDRNEHKKQQIENVFKYLAETPSYDLNKWHFLPVLISVTGRFIFKYICKCSVFISIKECDEELANYANREGCFAILSQDTDFLCLKNATYYLSIKRLCLDNMTTLLYDRCALYDHYSLTAQQMWLFATLLGNDIIFRGRLKKFHSNICEGDHSEDKKCVKIVEFVKLQTKSCCNDVQQAVPAIVSHLKKLKVNVHEKELRESLRSYQPSEMESWIKDNNIEEPWLEILELAYKRHVECEAIPDVYNTIAGHPYEIGIFLEKPGSEYQESSKIFFPLREKIYGILLHEKPRGKNPHYVKEYGIWDNKWHPEEIVSVPALARGISHPGLIALWTKDTQRIQLQRWILFAHVISPNLDPAVFYNLNCHYVVPVALLLYLAQINCHLQEKEIDAFIKQAVTVLSLETYNMNPQELLNGFIPTERMVNLSTLFGYGISMILFLMSVLGFPLHKVMPWYYFDGPLFHYFMLTANEGNEALGRLSAHLPWKQTQARIREDFSIIKAIIGPHTFQQMTTNSDSQGEESVRRNNQHEVVVNDYVKQCYLELIN